MVLQKSANRTLIAVDHEMTPMGRPTEPNVVLTFATTLAKRGKAKSCVFAMTGVTLQWKLGIGVTRDSDYLDSGR